MSIRHAAHATVLAGRTLRCGGLLLLTACSATLRGSGEPEPDDVDGAEAGPAVLDGGAPGATGPAVLCGDEKKDEGDDQDTPPGTQCEDYSVEVKAAIANVLIVLDRSGSMLTEGVDRWTPSVNAVGTLTSDYEEKGRNDAAVRDCRPGSWIQLTSFSLTDQSGRRYAHPPN